MPAWLTLVGLLLFLIACDRPDPAVTPETTTTANDETSAEDDFVWSPESFADKKIIRYQVPGWDRLSLQQKKLVYYLTQAGLSGRDIMYDQNYRHNLAVRHAIEKIIASQKEPRREADWERFMTYAKNVWFSSGIHHHYSTDKFNPEFTRTYFEGLLKEAGHTLSDEVLTAMFDPEVDPKKINLQPGVDNVRLSAVNFYDPDITTAEVEAFYAKKMDKSDETPISYGLNSKIVRNADGSIGEKVYSAQGMYAPAIKEIQKWLRKAVEVAENEPQRKALELLIEFYETGDLEKWDEYNIAWVQATEGDIDYINGFVEVYNDPLGYTGSYENIVEINDFEASERMAVVAENAAYFEENSPIMDAHKKKNVVGISYKVVNVAGESGDASPSTPIGVNLPNANWIRRDYGSKSVSLGNIVEGYANADGPELLNEFAFDQGQIDRSTKYGQLGGKMNTALHEVIGHASGQLEPGVATPKETLKNYSSALEEARADLVALYYILDPKLQEMGLIESDEVAHAQYEGYLRNGLMLQLRRIEEGKDIEQAHMRNRQMVSAWVLDKGRDNKVVELKERDGKTFIVVNDYAQLRELFGQLLREVQRIKSQGDYEAAQTLFETYGVKVDREMHRQVLARSEKLNIPPYGGFINPRLVPQTDDSGNITDIRVEYPDDFTGQMMEYGQQYGFLSDKN